MSRKLLMDKMSFDASQVYCLKIVSVTTLQKCDSLFKLSQNCRRWFKSVKSKQNLLFLIFKIVK